MKPPPYTTRSVCLCALAWLAIMIQCLVGGTNVAWAQDTWEYSPYRVCVWLAVCPSAELPPRVQQAILSELRSQAPVYAGATWRLEAERAPAALNSTLATTLEDLTVDRIAATGNEVFSADKLIFLTVAEDQGDFLLACRELDCQARSLSQVVHRRVLQRSRLARDCVAVVATTFSPLVRVEQSRGRHATARVRAGGLVRHEHCVSLVKLGDVLRPVIRRNDRRGEPKPGGIQEIDWTFLTVRVNSRIICCSAKSFPPCAIRWKVAAA